MSTPNPRVPPATQPTPEEEHQNFVQVFNTYFGPDVDLGPQHARVLQVLTRTVQTGMDPGLSDRFGVIRWIVRQANGPQLPLFLKLKGLDTKSVKWPMLAALADMDLNTEVGELVRRILTATVFPAFTTVVAWMLEITSLFTEHRVRQSLALQTPPAGQPVVDPSASSPSGRGALTERSVRTRPPQAPEPEPAAAAVPAPPARIIPNR